MQYSAIIWTNTVRLAPYALTRLLPGNRVCFTAQALVCVVFRFMAKEEVL